MGIKLYILDMSPPVRAAMMAFELFNVPHEKIEVDLLANEHRSPEYLKRNPLHSVPVMEDGDFILHDSHAILAYVAETYGKDDSWYPKDVQKRALVNQKLFFNTAILFPRLRTITYPIVMEGKKTIEQKSLDDVEEAYGFFEAFLNKTTYLAADHATIADVAALSTMSTLEFLLPIDSKKYPKTTAWLATMKKTSYYKKQAETGAVKLDQFIKSRITPSS